MTKISSPTDWLNLATSKDRAYPNLRAPYRDTDYTVATDGKRIHIVSSEKIEKGFSLSGEDVDFPSWRDVLPNNSDRLLASFSLLLAADDRKFLIGTSKFLKNNYCPGVTICKFGAVEISFGASHGKQFDLKFALRIANVKGDIQSIIDSQSSCIDLEYLTDATANKEGEGIFTISWYQGGQVLIEHDEGHCKAVVMAMRAPRPEA